MVAQFYLLFPLLLANRRWRFACVGLLALAGEIWIWIEPHTWLYGYEQPFRTDMNMHYLLWGGLLGMLLTRPAVLRAAKQHCTPVIAFGATLIILLICHVVGAFVICPGHGFFPAHDKFFRGDVEAVLLLMPFWMIATMLHPLSWSSRLLELPPLRFLGRIALSLYMWHIPFFLVRLPGASPQSNNTHGFLTHAPWNYLVSIALATVSYYLIELPGLRLGYRLAPSLPGRPELVKPAVSQ